MEGYLSQRLVTVTLHIPSISIKWMLEDFNSLMYV